MADHGAMRFNRSHYITTSMQIYNMFYLTLDFEG